MKIDGRHHQDVQMSKDIVVPGSDGLFVHRHATFADVIHVLQRHQDVRILPVIDEEERPVGAIFEKDVRRVLFNPYGHALLQNPGFSNDLEPHLKSCPSAEADIDVPQLLDIYAQQGGRDGMILTRNGRFHGVVNSETLLRLAAEREGTRREAMRHLSALFEVEATNLAGMVQSASNSLYATASETADRAGLNRDHAVSVAAAATQVSTSMHAMARECGHLAVALDDLHRGTIEAKGAAEDAVAMVAAGSVRAEELAGTTRSIERILDFIQVLAGQINLLALNARIEAAQAGESGRSFAVVAQEIKILGDQARIAAGEIATHIRDIQSTVAGVVTGHDGIERVITSVDSIFHSVESAVEYQRLIGRKLATDAMEVAKAGEDICGSIESIQANTIAAAGTFSAVRDLAFSLSNGSTTLQHSIADYIGNMRQA
jgi:methyl-accepting chemotaxis protein